jgi:hypothetical protein
MQAIDVNFKLNLRKPVFTYSNDQKFIEFEKKFSYNGIGTYPVLTNNEANNQRIVSLVNGDFVCIPVSQSIVRTFSEVGVTTLCSRSIPPVYGKFAGYLTAYLTREPTVEEQTQLRILLGGISQEIYERDLR